MPGIADVIAQWLVPRGDPENPNHPYGGGWWGSGPAPQGSGDIPAYWLGSGTASSAGQAGGIGTSDVLRSGPGVQGATVPFTGLTADPSTATVVAQSPGTTQGAKGSPGNQGGQKILPVPAMPGGPPVPAIAMQPYAGQARQVQAPQIMLPPGLMQRFMEMIGAVQPVQRSMSGGREP